LSKAGSAAIKSDDQHSELRWWAERDLSASEQVDENAKDYFR
jgi:hypothetical protein